jgi:hypothetical protein
MNLCRENSKKEFTVLNQSIAYNEDTRRSFFRKTIVNSIKTFEEFAIAFDPETIKKLEDFSKTDGTRYEEAHQKKIRIQMERALNIDHK